ncbi:hypoxanthine phosphoribosyltransferase [Saccharicrinis aurantiacus]|uniref:hypoxanthine phosphoribosyltransferase n=1 Tax=Saccharicrinis aurantiacus TaxID=1849719 RepID=UPI00094F9650|nr:hypoxanthine phosphoribosyltransferase [Saccharicrinis aurantiacus]
METIKILDREFKKSIPFETIDKAIDKIAKGLNEDVADKDPLLICILNGSFMFAADVMKKLSFPCQISFVKMASYEGTGSTGKIKELIGLTENLEGRTVVILEDIIDTGFTIEKVQKQMLSHGVADLKIATLLYKPEACKVDVKIDYTGLEIPNDFIVGYGLDYDGYGRNLADIYTVVE